MRIPTRLCATRTLRSSAPNGIFSAPSIGFAPESSCLASSSSMDEISIPPRSCVNWASNIILLAGKLSAPEAPSPVTNPKSGALLPREFLFEIRERALQSFFQIYFRLPLQNALRFTDVRAAPLGIILRERLKNYLRYIIEMFPDAFRELQYRNLLRVADIHRHVFVRQHQFIDSID